MLGENDWVMSNWDELNAAAAPLWPRRVRLLAAAICRGLLTYLSDADARVAADVLDAVELFADTGKTKVALKRGRQAVREIRHGYDEDPARTRRLLDAVGVLWAVEVAATENAVVSTIRAAFDAVNFIEDVREETIRRRFYAPYRDIAGQPSSLVFDPAWRTSTARSLATQMYESRDFSAMPILADALLDAGCDSDSVLSHCTGPKEPNNEFPPNIPTAPFVHVRGCWVVDAVLGKV